MTQRTFTPPTEFPATYKQGDLDVTLYGLFDGRYLGVWSLKGSGDDRAGIWSLDGEDHDGLGQLEDIPKRYTAVISRYLEKDTKVFFEISYDEDTGDNPTIEKVS